MTQIEESEALIIPGQQVFAGRNSFHVNKDLSPGIVIHSFHEQHFSDTASPILCRAPHEASRTAGSDSRSSAVEVPLPGDKAGREQQRANLTEMTQLPSTLNDDDEEGRRISNMPVALDVRRW